MRPSDDRLTPADRETFRAAYCGLCHALGARYGLVGRMILNYDLTFLAMVLSDGAGEMCAKRCAVHPMRRRCCVAGDPALDAAADMSVILTYWQLRDGVADHGFWGGLKYRIASVLLRPAYRKARERRPRFDAGTKAHLADLAALEQLEPANVPMPFVPQVRRTPRRLLKTVIIAAVCAVLATTAYAFWPRVAVILEGSRAYLAVQEAPQNSIPMEQMQLTYVPEGCTVAWDDSTYQKYGVYYCLIDNGKQGREQQLLGIAQMPLENKVNIQGRGPDDAITEEDKANIEQQIMIVDDIAVLTAEQIEDCSVVAWTAGDSYYVASVYRWQDKAEVVEILQGIR